MSFTIDQLTRSLHITEAIEKLQAELASVLSGAGKAIAPKSARKKRRRMSAAGRARIAAAQKARWAKVKKAEDKTPTETVKASAKSGKPSKAVAPKKRAKGRK